MSGNAPPALAVFANGVGAVSDANLNSFMQTGALAADLRQLTGLNSMTVYLVGMAAQGDGGEGIFVFNSASTAADDNNDVIAPSGSLQGRWLRQSGSGLMILFPTIAALRANTATPPPSAVVYVEGYYVGADGGEGMFLWDAGNTTAADNGGTLIVDAAGNRWLREHNRENYNIHWFGVPFVGDTAPALNAAFAAMVTDTVMGGQIEFKQQKYTFDSAITMNLPNASVPFSISLVGSGQSATTLYFPASNGLIFNCADPSHTVHVRDMSITTGALGLYNAIRVNQTILLGSPPGSDFTNITFGGDYPNNGVDFWGACIINTGLSFVDYEGLIGFGANTTGAGIIVSGNAALANQYSIVHNLKNCSFTATQYGFVMDDYVQGVVIDTLNFTTSAPNSIAVDVMAGAVGSLTQLTVTNSQMSCPGDAIVVASALNNLTLTGNLFFIQANASGVAVLASGALNNSVITGNNFSGLSATGSTGINVLAGSASTYNVVTGNIFYTLNVGSSLGAATTHWNVQANVYNTVGTAVVNSGTSNSIGVATS